MRRGKKKALMAVGLKIIIPAYHVFKNKVAYKEPILHNNPIKKIKKNKNYLEKLKELGLEVEIKQEV